MIIFRSRGYELDLTLFGLSLNDESNMFVDNMLKSYSFPFPLSLFDEFLKALGFPNRENNDDSESSLTGQLILDDYYFEATLRFGEIIGDEIECTLYYGEEELPIYGTKMASLPWPINLVTTLQALSDKYLNKGWPEVTHNFPAIYRPSIQEKSDYEHFGFFMNLKTVGGTFVTNIITGSDPDFVYQNRNVLSPCAYLLEMLSFGFKTAGRKVKGDVFEDERLKRLFYIPDTFAEKFRGSTYDNWQFSLPDEVETVNGLIMGVYKKTFTPAATGSYNFKFRLELDPVLAKVFDLRIYRKDTATEEETDIYTAHSIDSRVSLSEDINMNIAGSSEFDPVWIELRLLYTKKSLTALNSFEYAYKEGRLNELDNSYSLADFMPDMTFGDFVNAIKNWLNLDVRVNEEYAYIEKLDTALDALSIVDHQHLEIPKPKLKRNSNRLFKLTYKNGDQVMVDSSGTVFSDVDRQSQDIIEIKMETQIARVEENYGITTVVHPENKSLCFGIYDGLQGGSNRAIDSYEGFTGRVEDVWSKYWKKWLFRRTTNVTINDGFSAHQSEKLLLRSKIFKYNRILLPKVIRKKRRTQEYWEVEIEYESI